MAFISEFVRGLNLTRSSLKSIGVAFAILLVFGGGGAWMNYDVFLAPYLKSRQAENWESIEATVTKNEFRDSGDSKVLEIEYSYLVENQQYTNDRYELAHNSSNFIDEDYEKVNQDYPVGSKIPIWSNPDNPSQSVVRRELGGGNLFALVFSLPFVIIGLCALIYILLNQYFFKMQAAARKDLIPIASRHSAKFITKALSDDDFSEQEYAKLTFLKTHSTMNAFGRVLLSFVKCIVLIIFLVAALAFSNISKKLPSLFDLSIIVVLGIIVSPFIKLLIFIFRRGGFVPDYLILSTWDSEYQEIQHEWLLLSDQEEVQRVNFAYTTGHSKRKRRKQLEGLSITEHTAPNRSVISGSATQSIKGSKNKPLNLHLETAQKGGTGKKYEIDIYYPSDD